jgi:hypothetical protein
MVPSAFPAMDSRHRAADAARTGRVDRSALHGVPRDIEPLGLELVEVRQRAPGKERAP